MKRQIILLCAVTLMTGLVLTSCQEPDYPFSGNINPGQVTDIEFTDYSQYSIVPAAVNKDFIRGIDASEVKALEECGQKFYDENNVEKDVFQIFSENGVNWIRLRIWNDYTKALDSANVPYGYNNLNRTINMAKRAKKYGMKVLLDFHYSDTWADPSKQICPDMWKSITDKDELAEAVGTYTESVLKEMKASGCAPDMVQIGNEMQGGLFQTGSSVTDAKNYTADYLKAGAVAVKKVLPDCQIMLHMSNGGKAAYAETLMNYSTAIGKDSAGKNYISVIGVSYYPFYTSHGTDVQLKSVLTTLKNAGYKVVIAENSHAYSNSAYTDTTNNEFWTDDEPVCAQTMTGYNKGSGITKNDSAENVITASIENQAGVIQYLMELCSSVDSTGGYFYWGGCYLGIEDHMNSSWENQALFDTKGKVLPALKVFKVK